jgi:Ser/Thr protein kinase RdoA (MazF antagonist)
MFKGRTALSLPTVEAVAAVFGLSEQAELIKLEPHIFLFRAEGGEYALKSLPTDLGELDGYRYEHWVILGLIGRPSPLSFGLPAPVRDQAGASFHRRGNDYIWMLAPRLPGQAIRPNEPDQAYAAGAALGELHRALADLPALERPDWGDYTLQARVLPQLRRPMPDYPYELGLQDTPEGNHRHRRFIQLAKSFLKPPPPPDESLIWQVVHGDFFGDNVLYNGDAVSGVLDFKQAHPDYRAREFAITLMRMTNDWTALFWGTARPFVEGYSQFLRLSRAEIALLPRFMVEYWSEKVMFYLGHHPAEAAQCLRRQEELSTWLEAEEARFRKMLLGVFWNE